MINLVFLLEEPSAKEMLKGLLSHFIDPTINIEYIVFEGSRDLDKKLFKKIQYWQKPNSFFVILRDQDRADCRQLKEKLLEIIQETGKKEISIVRIACHELETFYLGDLKAVETALNIPNLSILQKKVKFRNPDALLKPSVELRAITAGYYQKIDGSRRIGPLLSLDGGNFSRSFNNLLAGIEKILRKAKVKEN